MSDANRGGGGGRARVRRGLPVLFLVVSLGVAGFGALEAYRAQRSHRATATGVLTDYGDFAAWSYQQRLSELIGASLERSFAIARQNSVFTAGTATEQCLELLLEDPYREAACACPPGLAGRYSFFTRLGDGPAAAQWAGERPTPALQARVVDAVRAHARRVHRDDWPFGLLHVDEGAGPLLAYVRLRSRPYLSPDLAGVADTLVYAFEVDRAKLARLFAGALGDEVLLPPVLTRGRPNHEVIQVEVTDPGGRVLFASRPGGEHTFPAEGELRAMLGGGTVRASVLPEAAAQLVIGGLPESHTPELLLIFALAGALAAAAIVQIRRENRLAILRQDFVASVSHELRTPLAQVRLFTETLRLGRAHNDEQRLWALDSIGRETLRLSHLVENILHFSRAERGLVSPEREPVDVSAELGEALAAFRPLVPAHRASFELDAPEGLVAEVHRDAFRQVVLNFLDNAVRYGRSGQTVRVIGAREGHLVRIAVEDEGPGVPPPERERIFEPFQRGAGAVGSVVVGSGIGLSVVRQIVRAHGGRVRVEDAPGGGARFVVELPNERTARDRHFRSAARETRPRNGGSEAEVA
jgi:signal transduction histidine kinase